MILRTVILGLLLSLVPVCAYSAPPLELGLCGDFCYLGKHLDILVDQEGALTLEEVRSPGIAAQFVPSQSDIPNMGRGYATYWLRFDIVNRHTTHQKRWLVMNPFMVTADLYLKTGDGKYEKYRYGSEVAFFQRSILNVKPIIQIDAPPGRTQSYYLRVRTPIARFKLELWSVDAFAQKESLNQFIYGIWMGCMLVAFFFNLFIFLSVKDPSYLYYILYISGITFSQMGLSGHSHYLFPPWLSVKSLFLFGAFYAFWGLQFCKSFLNTHIHVPRTHRILNVLMGACCIPVILILMGKDVEGSISVNLLGIVSAMTGLYVGIATLLKGYQPARFFLLAWSFLLTGVLITLLGAFRILPLNFLTENAIRIGSALEVILLSFALADRIHLMKAQKEKALQLQLAESEKYSQLSRTFEKFVPHEFIDCMHKENIVDVRLGDYSQREMTILFSDIRSFTALSERMTPEENFRFINSYLKRMEPAIRNHHGFIDKYIGDSIMALFHKEADDAVRAAIDMLESIPTYNLHRESSGYAPIRIGIGINTGVMMLGTIGGEKRMESTVISDAVNFASRVENMTKRYGASLLISEHTFWKLKDPSQYQLRIIGRVAVKGKAEPITVFEVLDGEPPEIQDKKMATLNQFEEAVSYYEMMDFKQASKIMNEILEIFPEDKAAQTYIERCTRLMQGG